MEKKRYEVFEEIKIIGGTSVFHDYSASSILYLAVSIRYCLIDQLQSGSTSLTLEPFMAERYLISTTYLIRE